MAITDTDLLLVQRGATPLSATVDDLTQYVKGAVDGSDINIASSSVLGVIRVGNNLQIDPGTGILSAVIPAGTEYKGTWTDPNAAPTDLQNGYFWVWDGGNGVTLSDASWGTANGQNIDNGDQLFYNGTSFDIIPGGGGGGVQSITGIAPINVDNTVPGQPEISIDAATTTSAGSFSAADKLKLDGIDPNAEANIYQNLSFTAGTSDGVVEIDQGGTNATIPSATGASAGLLSSADKVKLDNLSNVTPQNLTFTRNQFEAVVEIDQGGSDATIPGATPTMAGLLTASDKAKLDTFQPQAPQNLSFSRTSTDGTVGIDQGGADTTIPAATSSQAGLMTGVDKTKLINIESGAQVNVYQNLNYSSASASGSVTIDQGGTNATIPAATTSIAGLLTASDKTKLDGLVQTVPQNLSFTRNAVEADIIIDQGGTPATIPTATDTFAGLMSAIDKANLDDLVNNPPSGGTSVQISETPPATPDEGDLWYNSSDGRLYIYYVDADTSQWVDASPPGAGSGTFDPNDWSIYPERV